MTANNTPITERLAEAYQKLDAINEIIFAAENAAMACDVVQPTIKMLSDSDIKRIFDLSLHAEYEASRTHPAEGGQGRDYVLVPREPTEAMVSAGFDVHPCRTGETKVTDAYKAMLAAAPPPQPVAPDAFCVTAPDGAYVRADSRCMHQPARGEGRELTFDRSEEGHVGKERRSRGSPYD